MSLARWTTVTVLCLGGVGALASQPEPLGAEFQVNTYTTDVQVEAAVDVGPDGAFVVAWESYYYDIRARRFAADGTPLGDDFQANSLASYDRHASVAVGSTGEFVIVWDSYNGVGGSDPLAAVAARRFAADGTPLGPEFQVNTFTTGYQGYPDVAFTPGGEFIVVWSSSGSSGNDDSGYSIQMRRFAGDGTPLGDDFQVNTYTTSYQYGPAIEAAQSGEFIVVWSSLGSSGNDNSNASVQARRFAADATPSGDDFQVNSYTTDRQFEAVVGAGPEGDFMITWTSYGSAGNDPNKNVQARLFAADGVPQGDDFQVNTYTSNQQNTPAVAAIGPAGFLVTWTSRGSTGSDTGGDVSVQGRVFSGDGAPSSDDFQINTQTADDQIADAAAVAPNGDFVVVWTSGSSAEDPGAGILGQRFLSPALIFADGFESGDTSAWSSTVP